jgi:cytochrome c biogenesis protein CcdA
MEPSIALIEQWLSSGSLFFASIAAFLGGGLTALNPCVLVMVPLLIGFIGGVEQEITTGRSLAYTLVFVLGFSVELAVLFSVGLAAAPFLQSPKMIYVVAGICIVLGLHFMGLFRTTLPISQESLPKATGYLGAALFGFMFGLISLPCTGPALLLIVSLIPVKGPLFGGVTMLFYGIGHCLLIIAVGVSAGAARHILASNRFHRAQSVVKTVAGGLLAIVGFYIALKAAFPGFSISF